MAGAKLTIAPGATIEYEAGAKLLVSLNGRLEALGTAASPITIRGSQQGAKQGASLWGARPISRVHITAYGINSHETNAVAASVFPAT